MPIPLPKWLDKDYPTEREKKKARTRYLLRLAALYATPGGHLVDLATLLGYKTPSHFATVVFVSGQVRPELAIAIERLVGRKVISRGQLRPDLFEDME